MNALRSLLILLALVVTSEAAVRVSFEPQDEQGRVIPKGKWKALHPQNTEYRARTLTKATLADTNQSLIGKESVVISSMCATVSTNTPRNRINAICGMAGLSVPTNRLENPAAWWQIPENGFQSFDHVTTSFNSWMGTTTTTNPAVAGEFGNRVLVSMSGLYPVSAYTCRIMTTLPGFPPTTNFSVGTNSAGMEIPFSANFPGIDFGTNGICESFPDLQSGEWTQGGDDTVYVSGEFPSQVPYSWWVRLGITISTTILDPSGFDTVNSSFITATQNITAEIFKNGSVVARKRVSEAQPMLSFERSLSPSTFTMGIHGGQLRIPYTLLSAPAVSGSAWTTFEPSPLSTGSSLTISNITTRFFRLKTGYP
jgi:hypothetical protein